MGNSMTADHAESIERFRQDAHDPGFKDARQAAAQDHAQAAERVEREALACRAPVRPVIR